MSNCKVVEEMIGLTERYELFICSHCADHQHADCLKDKATLVVAGDTIHGTCQCSHGIQRKKGKADAQNSGS